MDDVTVDDRHIVHAIRVRGRNVVPRAHDDVRARSPGYVP